MRAETLTARRSFRVSHGQTLSWSSICARLVIPWCYCRKGINCVCRAPLSHVEFDKCEKVGDQTIANVEDFACLWLSQSLYSILLPLISHTISVHLLHTI